MAYNGLPNSLCKIAWTIFILICDRVRYEGGKAKDGCDYISLVTTVDEILSNIRSIAYSEGKKVDTDRRNYKRHFADLHKHNVFYLWKCGRFYGFIMEREIRSWLFYNKEGCVTPKTVFKIISRARGMINDMVRAHSRAATTFKNEDIENSFGFFMNNMINKMNPLIASEDLPVWDKSQHIYDYLDELEEKLESLETFDGLTEDPHYGDRIPKYMKDSLKKVDGGKVMKSDLEKELAPTGDAGNMAKKPRKKRQKKETAKEQESGRKPKKRRYNKTLKPFEDGPSFTKYYKAYLQNLSGSTKMWFDDVQADNRVAVEILDLLRIHKVNNKEFLNDWIQYYFEHFLKGNKARKAEHTSLSKFRYTFERYKETRYVPQ